MKKKAIRSYKRLRHKVCRFLYGFYDCPIYMRRNYNNLFNTILAGLGLAVACGAFMVFMILLA